MSKKLYTEPSITVSEFSMENIVTLSVQGVNNALKDPTNSGLSVGANGTMSNDTEVLGIVW